MKRRNILSVLLLALSVALLPIQSAFAEGAVPAEAIPAPPPSVYRVNYRVNSDGSREVVAVEKVAVATVNSQGSGTRLENFLDDNTNWSADYYVEFVVGI